MRNGSHVSKRLIAAVVTAWLVASCAPRIATPPQSEQPAPPDFPGAYYRDALTHGRAVYRVDPATSLVVIDARRGGSLAHLGHDHVIAAHNLQGYVAPDDGRSDLYVQLDQLVVDEPALRAEAKFDTQPSADDIAGTRQNMLRALQSEQYPFALIAISRVDAARLKVAISLHGATRTVEIPALIDAGATELAATGHLALSQTDFGVKPFSILGGAVQVQDQVDLRFSIRARRIEAAP
jgi:YceI-like protein